MNRRTKEAISAIDQLLMQLSQTQSSRAAFVFAKQSDARASMSKSCSARSFNKLNNSGEGNRNMPCEFTPSKFLQQQLKHIHYAKLIRESVALKPVDVFDEMDYFDCDRESAKLKISYIYRGLIVV